MLLRYENNDSSESDDASDDEDYSNGEQFLSNVNEHIQHDEIHSDSSEGDIPIIGEDESSDDSDVETGPEIYETRVVTYTNQPFQQRRRT